MKKEVIYGIVLIGTIFYGYLFQRIKNTRLKKWASSSIGILIVLALSREHAYFSFVLVTMNFLIICMANRRFVGYVSFAFSFIFLMLFRTCVYFHFYSPPDINAIQMILTLRMVGLAFELQDDTYSNNNTCLQKVYTFFDVFHYGFCYAGIVTGPYFSYKTYADMINCQYLSSVPTSKILLENFKKCAFYFVQFLIASHFFPISVLDYEFVSKGTFLSLFIAMIVWFYFFRVKMYLGFLLGECVCIMAGIGCYPSFAKSKCGHGPKDPDAFEKWNVECLDKDKLAYDYETIRNINTFNCEFARDLKMAIRNWNMTIQYWLFVNIYKQVPVKLLRTPLTLLISAIWHGTNPGYYMTLLMIPLVLIAQKKFDEAILARSMFVNKKLHDWFSWLITLVVFGYILIPFITLDLSLSFAYWKSLYYVGHIIIISLFLFGFFFSLKTTTKT